MYCVKCCNDLSDCVCPDIDERLAQLAAGGHVAFATCPECGRHVDRCRCESEPEEVGS